MAENDDEELLSRRASIEAALREVHDDLFRFLARRLGDKHDAADVLQEFYVRVLKSFADLKDDNKLRPWMDQVLRSAIADHYRRRSRDNRLKEDYRTETLIDGPVSDEDVDLVVCACLYKLLPTIHEEYASLVWQVDLLGKPRDDVRASLGLTENAFRVKLHRARQTLRDRLEQSCDACPDHKFLNCGCERAEVSRGRPDQESLRSGGDA